MLLLLACATPTVKGTPAEHPDVSATGTATVTGEPVETWSPVSFTVEAAFAFDGAYIVPWTQGITGGDTQIDFTFTDADGVTCEARASFDPDTLEVVRFTDMVLTTWGPVDETLEHHAWVGAPTGVATDCPAIDPDEWGVSDVAGLIRSWEWGAGFGEVRSDRAPWATDELFGGSIMGDPIDSGSPPVEAAAWATAAAMDEGGEVRTDVWGQPILLASTEVVGREPPPALYRVLADLEWSTASLR